MNTPNNNSNPESPKQEGIAGAAKAPAEETKAAGAKRKINAKAIRIAAIVVAILVVLAGLVYRFKSLGVAAMVNGQPISRLAVVKELEKQGGKDVLNTLIDKKLVTNEAKAKGITVSPEEVDREIKKYEDQFNANGSTLDDTLAAQNMTRDSLKEQIAIQLQIAKLLGDKGNVSDAEVESYIKDNSITLPQGQEDAAKSQIKNQLQQQKLSEELGTLLSGLKSKANIKTFVNY